VFIHLHNHFRGSFSDSALPLKKTIEKAKKIGHKAIAITDHGELFFVPEFHKVCIEEKIKPIIGCEIYFVEDASFSIKNREKERYHLILIAKDEIGYKNLVRIVSRSWTENNFFGKRGLVDWKLLEKYSEGLICDTACFYNPISQKFFKEGILKGEMVFLRLKEIFGDDLFLEVGRHNIKEEEESNEFLISISKKYNVPVILTNDVHYLNKDDWLKHDLIIKSRFGRISDFKVDSQDYWYKTTEEMLSLGFPDEFLKNTLLVEKKCSIYELPFKGDFDWVDFDVFSVFPEIILKEEAERISKEVLGKIKEDIVEGVAGFYRRLRVNPQFVLRCNKNLLGEVIPLRVTEGVMTVQFPYEEIKKYNCYFDEDLSKIKNKDVLMWLGWAFFRRDDFKNAEEFFKRALSSGSKNPLNFYGIGIIKWKKDKNLKEAKKCFLEYLKIDSDSKRALKVKRILEVILEEDKNK